MFETVLKRLKPWGPVFFGVGFLAPLIATLLVRAAGGSSHSSSTWIGIACGATWGFYAKIRGSWL